jgi:hypothetical protein
VIIAVIIAIITNTYTLIPGTCTGAGAGTGTGTGGGGGW